MNKIYLFTIVKNISKLNLLENIHIEASDLKLTKPEKEKILNIYSELEISREKSYYIIHMNDLDTLEDKDKIFGINSQFFSNGESSDDNSDVLF